MRKEMQPNDSAESSHRAMEENKEALFFNEL
jgi:hypothetical protein